MELPLKQKYANNEVKSVPARDLGDEKSPSGKTLRTGTVSIVHFAAIISKAAETAAG